MCYSRAATIKLLRVLHQKNLRVFLSRITGVYKDKLQEACPWSILVITYQ